MNLTPEQIEVLQSIANAYEEGHRSEFILYRTHDGSSVLFKDNHQVPTDADILDFKRLATEGLIDFDMSGREPTGKITARGLAVFSNANNTDKEPGGDPRSVFVVHGQDEKIRESMFIFLRAIGLNPIEWNQAVKFTGEASPYVGTVLDVAFQRASAIVVIFTPDEEVLLRKELRRESAAPGPSPEFQARPNVLFEAGMAMGRCLQRTILVEVGKLRPFSDIGGRHVVRFDGNAKVRKELAQRLETAGCPVDITGTDWLSAGDFEIALPDTTIAKTEIGRRTEIDRNDALNRIESWMNHRPYQDSSKEISFSDVDEELNLPDGTARELLPGIAEDLGYKEKRKGSETILLTKETVMHGSRHNSRWG